MDRRQPRVLLVACDYFLVREIGAALSRLGLPCRELPLVDDAGAFARSLAEAALAFRPTVLLTVNRYGLDDGGRVLEVARRLSLPVACWLIDSDTILCGGLTGPEAGLVYATCDKAAVGRLSAVSGLPALYLPLAADPELFRPGPPSPGDQPWRTEVLFVGHSWTGSIEANRRTYAWPEALLAGVGPAAAAWERQAATPLWDFLAAFDPGLYARAMALEAGRRKWFAALVLWEAARIRRARCVSRLLPFDPLVVGDAGWDTLLAGAGRFRRLDDIGYAALPGCYPLAKLVVNSTSPQMAMAVNQRVFDVPCCGGFVVTERRPELEELFEIGAEVACYDREEDMEETVRHFLVNPARRRAVTAAGRRRVLADHTYDHRLRRLLAHLRDLGV